MSCKLVCKRKKSSTLIFLAIVVAGFWELNNMSFIFLSKNETDNTLSTPINFIKKYGPRADNFLCGQALDLAFQARNA